MYNSFNTNDSRNGEMDEEQKKEGENGSENFWEKGLEGEHHQSIPYIFMKCDNKDHSFHN